MSFNYSQTKKSARQKEVFRVEAKKNMRLFLTFFAFCSAITQSTSAIGDDNECKDSDSNEAKRRCEINCISEDIKGVIACKYEEKKDKT